MITELGLELQNNSDPKLRFQHFVDKGCSVNLILYAACMFARPEWCEMALRAGAHANGRDWAQHLPYWQMSYLPICEAIRVKAYACLPVLVQWGARLDIGFGLGKQTPMCQALDYGGDYQAVEWLLKLGANPHGCGGRGMWITRAPTVEITELFLDYGANVCDIDAEAKENNVRMRRMLERRGRCKRAAATLCGVLQKRYRVAAVGFLGDGGHYRLPKQMVAQMAQWVWDTRQEMEWLQE